MHNAKDVSHKYYWAPKIFMFVTAIYQILVVLQSANHTAGVRSLGCWSNFAFAVCELNTGT